MVLVMVISFAVISFAVITHTVIYILYGDIYHI
jgi:hypothetical protein